MDRLAHVRTVPQESDELIRKVLRVGGGEPEAHLGKGGRQGVEKERKTQPPGARFVNSFEPRAEPGG